MRTRIIIVVLGLTLGLGARFGVDRYRQAKGSTKTDPPASMKKTEKPNSSPEGKWPAIDRD